ncbi:MAG: hypothetical protein JNK72_17605, partial [Myxococcales bacterium]|nr:hypothetical protein [Myxococcales bacterium]
HRYRLGQAELPIVGGDPHLFETVRHFDVVADLNADRHTLTWVRPTQGGAQAVYIARRYGVVGPFQPPVAMPWPNNEPVYSSVSISPSPENEYHHALTVGGQP